MKEKYESLSLATLKDLAKARGLKGISTMRKPELIERMLEEDRKEQTAENEQTISGTAEENTIPARPEPVAAEKTENTGSVSSPERREAPTRSRTIIRRNPEYRSNNYGRNENAGRQNSYNGENRPENFVKRTPVAKPVEVVPPAELRPEETEQPRTGAASEATLTMFRLKRSSLTVAKRPMESWRLCRMGLDLSEVRIIFQEKMISMFLRHRSADSI